MNGYLLIDSALPTTPQEVHRRATRMVAARALDRQDALFLLTVLGLDPRSGKPPVSSGTGSEEAKEFIMSDSIEDLFSGGGAPVFKFAEIGAKVVGTITGLQARQQRDFATKELVTWDDGNPKMELVITLATKEHDPEIEDDDGSRRLIVKGQMLTSLREAVRTVGATKPEIGGKLAVAYMSDGEPPAKGLNAPKQYAAAYERPAAKEVDAMFDQPAEPPTWATEEKPKTEPGGFDPSGLAGLLAGA